MTKKYTPPVSGVDYNVPINEAIKRAKNVDEFYILISYDTSFQLYRNPIIDEWRSKFVAPIKEHGPLFGGWRDVLALEDHLDHRLFGYAVTEEQKNSMSVYEKCVKVYGEEYANAWQEYLNPEHNLYKYLIDRYDTLVKESQAS